jgi:hypothetical protein
MGLVGLARLGLSCAFSSVKITWLRFEDAEKFHIIMKILKIRSNTFRDTLMLARQFHTAHIPR